MRLQLDARARRWLGRLPVVNLYSAAELVLMALLAAQIARLIWAVATPVGPLGEWRPAAIVTPASPLDTLTGFDPFFRVTGATEAGPVAVTTLQLQLFGIRLNDATGGGSAIVAGADGVQNSVSVGEEVAPGVRLVGVAFDHVTLDRAGAREDLFLDQSRSPTPAAPVAAVPGVSPGALTDPTSPDAATPTGIGIGQLRSEIGFIPRIDGGRLSGLTVRSQGSGRVFREAGLRDGDIVTSIAGRPVTGAGDLDRVARDFAAGGNIPITVERNSNVLQLAITIAAP